jgi:hypothetical protein
VGFFFGLLFGAVGTGYLIYGKRQYSAAFAVTGVLLIVYPYFVSSALAVALIGAALIAAPFILQRLG